MSLHSEPSLPTEATAPHRNGVAEGTGSPSLTGSEPVAQPAVIRFCRVCGGPWDLVANECPACRLRPLPAVGGAPAEAVSVGLLSAIVLYFCYLAVALVAIVVYRDAGSEESVRIDFVVTGVSAGLTLLFCAWHGAHVWPLLVSPARPQWYLLAVGGAGLTFVVAWCLLSLVHGMGVPVLEYSLPFLETGYGWWTIVLVVCVCPAIFEELAFRGVIQGALLRVLSPWQAVLVSAAVFTVIHLSVVSFAHLLAIGLALGWLRWRSRSLYPGMLLHFLHNLLCVLTEGSAPWSSNTIS